MAASSPNPGNLFPLSWGIAIAAVSLVAVGGGSIIWSQRSDDTSGTESVRTQDVSAPRRVLPQPPPDTIGAGKNSVYSVAYAVENGTPIVKIRVTQTGDEMIVDAATGRLIETRPTRRVGPGPMGRVVIPWHPVT